MIGGTYEGKLSADGKTITGNWTQGPTPLPLNLTRATPETEWTIPPPPPKLPPMDANANPSFEVATIKPSKPDDQRKAFIVQGNRFQIINQPLVQILCFAYDVQAKQLIGLPPWAETDKYDIDAKPDGEGAPSGKQWKTMIQKMVAERFKLTFHPDKKELSVYVLSVAKGGPKLTKSEGDPNGLPGLFFRGQLGDLGRAQCNYGRLYRPDAERCARQAGHQSDRPHRKVRLHPNLDTRRFAVPGNGSQDSSPNRQRQRATESVHRHPGADWSQARSHQGARGCNGHRPCREAFGELSASE